MNLLMRLFQLAQRLNQNDQNFEQAFKTMLGAKREQSVDVDLVVRDILADVRIRGDDALLEYTAKFDQLTLQADQLRISSEEIASAVASVSVLLM